jgi:hypothetical protein
LSCDALLFQGLLCLFLFQNQLLDREHVLDHDLISDPEPN